MAVSYKDIIITPYRADSTYDPRIEWRGANSSANVTITSYVYPTSNGMISFEGSSGQLFSLTNDMTGSIYSVNDVSGIPSIDVNADGTVALAPYTGKVGVGTTSPAYSLDVNTSTGGRIARFYALTSGDAWISVDAGTSTSYMYTNRSGNGGIGTLTNNNFTFRTNNADRVTVDTSGNMLMSTGYFQSVSPNSGSTGAIRLADASGNPGVVYLQAVNNAGTSQYGYLKFETNGNITPSGNWNGNASTATAAQGSTFYTASSASEGQIGALYSGYNSCYLYNNSTQWGFYSASGGSMIYYSRADSYTYITSAGTSRKVDATAGTGSRVVCADGSGYINNNYFNSTDDVSGSNMTYVMGKFGDNYYRSGTAERVGNFLARNTAQFATGWRGTGVAAFGPAISNYFGATSAVSLAAGANYVIEVFCHFTKTTAGTVTWTPTFSAAPTLYYGEMWVSPIAGLTSAVVTPAQFIYETAVNSTGIAFTATGSLTSAVNHLHRFRFLVSTNAATNFRLNATQSAGTMTPIAGSFYAVTPITGQMGSFAA